VDGWVDGWMDGRESGVKDCLQQSKMGSLKRAFGASEIIKVSILLAFYVLARANL
jgi:hypothetical protein